jgi:putative oligomerization/nucleic acid binding protein
MKKLISVTLIALCALTGFSQKCSYYKNEIDKFTGKKVVATKTSLFSNGLVSHCDFYFVYSKESLSVQLSYGEEFGSTRSSIEIDLSSELWFSLADGSVMKLKPTEVFKGQFARKTCLIQPWYPITREQIETLSKTSIKSVRIGITQSYIEKDVESKDQTSIAEAASCFLKEAPAVVASAPATATSTNGNTSTSNSNNNVADELIKLKSLLDAGVITQQEFDTQKKKLLEAK